MEFTPREETPEEFKKRLGANVRNLIKVLREGHKYSDDFIVMPEEIAKQYNEWLKGRK